MLSRRNVFPVNARIKNLNFIITMVLMLLISAGCATHHKYKKKAEPCPCEKTNKR